jgi:hypothetical protein
VIEQVLSHELQLGELLNHSVQQHRRADFALLLAMLTDDVTEHSQFHLPSTHSLEAEHSDQYYRKLFSVAEPAPLAIEQPEQFSQFNQAQYIQQQSLTNIQLSQALKAKPLAQRDNKMFIDADILANTSLHCQRRHKHRIGKSDVGLSSSLEFNAVAWLNTVKQTKLNLAATAN